MIKAKTEDLKKCRILEGLSQTEVAEKININPGSYCMIENGKLGAKPKTAKAICDLFQKPFDDLFTIEQSKGV